jgi:excisionase family DNA binding protein
VTGNRPDPDERLLTKKEVAERLRVDERTIDRYIASGALASYQIGRLRRISEKDLRRFLAERWDG